MLVLALLFPAGVQMAHTLEGHDHPTCTEYNTHIHEKQLDCSLCDFQISVFDFNPDFSEYLVTSIENFKSEIGRVELNSSSHTGFISLRGPPYLV
ncbi:MAG: hypothetical protein KJO39_00880 [Bacteroidia bacterium]|nr:hypothetical protein [Bacteroidia bacterium]NNJ82160.1 hypothetical protein [Flavobacteriaceae bacterium]